MSITNKIHYRTMIERKIAMPEINESIRKKLSEYQSPIDDICKKVIAFAQSMPESAVKEHLDQLVRKAVKQEEAKS